MAYRVIFFACLVALSSKTLGQVDDSKIRQLALRKSNPDSSYKFHNSSDSTDTHLHYLGIIRSKNGQVIKIMTSCWRWGIENHRATNRILLFDHGNRYLGDYPVTMTSDLPTKIKANQLIFSNPSGSDCDPNVFTAISFSNGIPKQFFRKCKGQDGDIYSFDSN
jgi:hypothetical protein